MSWANPIIVIRPTAAVVPCFRFGNPSSFVALRLRLRAGFPMKVPRRSVYWISRSRRSVGVEDEDYGVLPTGFELEQQHLINGSSQINIVGFSHLEPTLNNTSKWVVVAVFGAILLWRHDAESLWAAMGSAINSTLSIILKRMLNQKRPSSTLRSDPGMPSSHAQSIFFIATFSVVSSKLCSTLLLHFLICNTLTSYMLNNASWLRISQKLHSISQVLVGAVLGFCFSALWFWLWDAVFMKAFVSSLLVRIIVLLGAAGFCVAFIIYFIRHIEQARQLMSSGICTF
nr:lipid phosphate phosphatase epsilon 2, chloroplastic [Ipomoea batatas]